MDDILATVLHKDEKILWEGKAEPFVTLDRTHKQAYLKKAVITLAVSLTLAVLYFMVVAEINPVIPAAILLVAGYICLKPILDARKLRRARYLITTERLVLITDEVVNAVYSDIPVATVRKDADGHSSLLCGRRAIAIPPEQRRNYAVTGAIFDMDTKICDSLIFYAISDAEKVKEILRPYLTVN